MPPMAKLVDVESIGSYFESLSDPRHTRNRKHLLVDIVVIAVCGVICGCDGPTAIHRWATHRASWLAQHLAVPNGIPSPSVSSPLTARPVAGRMTSPGLSAPYTLSAPGPAR